MYKVILTLKVHIPTVGVYIHVHSHLEGYYIVWTYSSCWYVYRRSFLPWRVLYCMNIFQLFVYLQDHSHLEGYCIVWTYLNCWCIYKFIVTLGVLYCMNISPLLVCIYKVILTLRGTVLYEHISTVTCVYFVYVVSTFRMCTDSIKSIYVVIKY